MAEAKIDNNRIPTIQGVLNTDGVTPTNVKIDPSTHALFASDGSSGSDLGNDSAYRDNNGNPTLIATDVNNNIIPLYVNSSGHLMIQTT